MQLAINLKYVYEVKCVILRGKATKCVRLLFFGRMTNKA